MRTHGTPQIAIRFLRNCLSGIFLLALLCTSLSFGQSIGDFRSRQSGNWTDSNTWEEFTATGWQNTNSEPTSNSGLVTIRSPHNIVGNDREDFDELVIEFGAELVITQVMTILDGPGIDLEVFGNLIINRTLDITGASSALFHGNSYTEIGAQDKIFFGDTSSTTFDAGATILNNGTFQPEGNSVVLLQAGSVLTIGDKINMRNNAILRVSQSTILNQSTFTINNSASTIFDDGGIYIHDMNGGNFPIASGTTWNSGSEARVIGVVNNLPARMDHSFHDFTWNAVGQTTDGDIGGAILGIIGDLSIESTGTGSLTWDGAGSNLTIGGSYLHSGGDFRYSDKGSSTMTVVGDFDVTGGSYTIAESSGNPILTVAGDFTVSSSLTETGTGFGSILLSSSSTQTIDAPATLSGDIDVTVSGTGTAVLADDFFVPGHFLETSGGLNLANFDIEVEGDFSVTSSLSNPAQVLFSGTSASQIQLPAASGTLPELVIDKPASSLALLSDVSISTTSIVRNGTLDVNGQALLIPHGSTLYNLGTVTGNVTIKRDYTQNSDGWRMLATPVSGVVYSNLNASFWTQGAPWANKLGGDANLQSYNFGTQDWDLLSGADAGFAPGLGYILYMYALDELGAPILPATWSVSGSPGSLPAQALSFATSISDSYNLVGNPSTTNLDWNLTHAASTNMEPSYATWDPSVTAGGGTTGYKYYDASSGIGAAGRYVAPFTSFMVAANAAGPQIQFTSSEAAARSSAVHYGKGNGIAPHIRLLLEGEGLAEDETYMSFGSVATDESGLFDVPRLNPLSAQFTTMWSSSNDRRLAFDGRTMSEGREVYDLVIATTMEGIYTLSAASMFEIPENWIIELIDLHTGNRADLRAGDSIQFRTRSSDLVSISNPFHSSRPPRFRLIIEDPDRAGEAGDDLYATSTQAVLAQNYPNPFNPSTTIRFSIPESQKVQLQIFDVLGRHVQTLVNNRMDAGWHEIYFRAENLASGVYLYNLTVGSQSLSKQMLLLK